MARTDGPQGGEGKNNNLADAFKTEPKKPNAFNQFLTNPQPEDPAQTGDSSDVVTSTDNQDTETKTTSETDNSNQKPITENVNSNSNNSNITLDETSSEKPLTVAEIKENLLSMYDEKVNAPKMEDTHERTTFFIDKQLKKRLDKLSKNKHGYKKIFYNTAIRALLDEIAPENKKS